MRIKRVQLENFGCIESAEINFEGYTALIGPNNAGKSTILSAIDKFFSSTPRIERRHFFRHENDRTISISITFAHLTPAEIEEFEGAIIDGEMTVTRYFGGEDSGLYAVEAMSLPAFAPFRDEKDGRIKRRLYADLRESFGLAAASGADMDANLLAWEKEHPDQLARMKTRGFFGAPNVANGKLKKKTSVRFVPAVVDINSQTDNPKTSPIIEILSDIRKQTLENKEDFAALLNKSNEEIIKYIEGADTTTISNVSDDITNLVQRYYPDTKIIVDLPPANKIEISFPPPVLQITHRAISGGVDDVGHGLQRAILFSVVQFLAQHLLRVADQTDGGFTSPASDILIMVEEPEIYQHPIKQRIIRSVLEEICREFDRNTGIRVQVILCTHSEKFVRIRDINSLRIVRTNFDGENYDTSVSSLTLEKFRDLIFLARGQGGEPMPVGTFGAGLHVFSEAISEGFFSEKVILVEGVDDAAVVEGAFTAQDRDPELEGIAILPVDGKTKLDKPLQAFMALGIPVCCVFDNDRTSNMSAELREQRRKYNHLLQNICQEPHHEDFPSGKHKHFVAIEQNLERYLQSITGDRYEEFRAQASMSFGISASDLTKSPATVSAFIKLAKSNGYNFPLFDSIVEMIDGL